MQETVMKIYFLTICILHASSLVKGERSLEIFENVGGDVTKVASNVIELPSGLNVTLICKVVTNKNEKATKTPVRWFKMPSNSKLSSKVTANFKNAATLKLEKLSLADAGDYACVSLKYGFIKDINLIVTNGDIHKSSKITISKNSHRKKFKRDIIPANRTAYDNFDIDLYRQSNLPSFRDTLDETQRYLDIVEKQRAEEAEERRRQDDYFSNTNNYYNTNHSSHSNSSPWKPILLAIGCLVFSLAVGGLVYCCNRSRYNSNAARRAQRSEPFYCYPNNQNRYENPLLNPSTVCVNQVNPLAPTAPLCASPQVDVPITSLIGVGGRRGDLDIPPNYNTSVHSSKHSLHEPTATDELSTRVVDAVDSKNEALPPSYTEALATDDLKDTEHAKDHGSSSYNHSSTHGHDNNGHNNYSSVYAHDYSSSSHGIGGDNSRGAGGHSGGGGDSGGGGGDSGGGGDRIRGDRMI